MLTTNIWTLKAHENVFVVNTKAPDLSRWWQAHIPWCHELYQSMVNVVQAAFDLNLLCTGEHQVQYNFSNQHALHMDLLEIHGGMWPVKLCRSWIAAEFVGILENCHTKCTPPNSVISRIVETNNFSLRFIFILQVSLQVAPYSSYKKTIPEKCHILTLFFLQATIIFQNILCKWAFSFDCFSVLLQETTNYPRH